MNLKTLFLALGAIFLIILLSNSSYKPEQAPILPEKTSDERLLPDLKVTPPKELFIKEEQGVRKIRFETSSFNIGVGPLELKGVTNPERTKTVAYQIIRKKDGTNEERKVGEFVFHPEHNHWHIENYTQFQLWRYGDDGVPTELVTTTDKMSFCVWDEKIYEPNIQNVPPGRTYPECSRKTQGIEIQGNSVGWGDSYAANFEGQELIIDGVPDGNYLVKPVINVDNKILESDFSNNESSVYVEIKGNKLTVLAIN